MVMGNQLRQPYTPGMATWKSGTITTSFGLGTHLSFQVPLYLCAEGFVPHRQSFLDAKS